MRLVRTLVVTSFAAVVLALAAVPAGAQSAPTLTGVRAGGHTGFDRVVFEFDGAVPEHRVGYVDQLVQDGSGRPVPVEPPEPAVETSMTRREGLDWLETLIGRLRSTPTP